MAGELLLSLEKSQTFEGIGRMDAECHRAHGGGPVIEVCPIADIPPLLRNGPGHNDRPKEYQSHNPWRCKRVTCCRSLNSGFPDRRKVLINSKLANFIARPCLPFIGCSSIYLHPMSDNFPMFTQSTPCSLLTIPRGQGSCPEDLPNISRSNSSHFYVIKCR